MDMTVTHRKGRHPVIIPSQFFLCDPSRFSSLCSQKGEDAPLPDDSSARSLQKLLSSRNVVVHISDFSRKTTLHPRRRHVCFLQCCFWEIRTTLRNRCNLRRHAVMRNVESKLSCSGPCFFSCVCLTSLTTSRVLMQRGVGSFIVRMSYSGLICNCSHRASFEEVDDEEDDGSNCK